jgi:hypothetical protein
MAGNNLTQLTDTQLLHLFEMTAKPGMSRRLKQIISELESRGYIFDEAERDFVTCAEWNQRHTDKPLDCNEQARLRRNREREARMDH